MNVWPPKLVDDIARRRAAVVVGAGVSRQATDAQGHRPPLWKGFLTKQAETLPDGDVKEHIKLAISQGELLYACEWLKTQLSDQSRWIDVLRKVFTEPRYQYSDLHRIIARLDLRVNFSLNFDTILDRAFDEVQGGVYNQETLF